MTLRFHELNLAFEPLIAGRDFPLQRLLVQPTLAAQQPLEMLHDIGHEYAAPVYSRIDKRPIEQLACRPDEWVSLHVLLVARLFTDQHEARVCGSLTEYRLGGVLPQRTGFAGTCGVPQATKLFFIASRHCRRVPAGHQQVDRGTRKQFSQVGLGRLAERTGLEPATPGVTGRYSNQLNYRSDLVGAEGIEPPTFAL